MKTLLLLIATALTVEAQTVPPTLTLSAVTNHNIIVTLTAGSEGAPQGFTIRWSSPSKGTGCYARYPQLVQGTYCRGYLLQPFQSVDILLGEGTADEFCRKTNCRDFLNCATLYRIQGLIDGLGELTNEIVTFTKP